MSSCNKTFKQVLSIFFKSDLRFICTLDSTLNLSEIRRTVSELVKMLLEPFSNLPNWIYIYIKYHIKALHFFKYSKLNIYIKKTLNNIFLVSSAAIFSTAIEYGTSSSSIDSNELLNWIFSHSLRDSLDGTRNPIGCSCNR